MRRTTVLWLVGGLTALWVLAVLTIGAWAWVRIDSDANWTEPSQEYYAFDADGDLTSHARSDIDRVAQEITTGNRTELIAREYHNPRFPETATEIRAGVDRLLAAYQGRKITFTRIDGGGTLWSADYTVQCADGSSVPLSMAFGFQRVPSAWPFIPHSGHWGALNLSRYTDPHDSFALQTCPAATS